MKCKWGKETFDLAATDDFEAVKLKTSEIRKEIDPLILKIAVLEDKMKTLSEKGYDEVPANPEQEDSSLNEDKSDSAKLVSAEEGR